MISPLVIRDRENKRENKGKRETKASPLSNYPPHANAQAPGVEKKWQINENLQ